MLPIRTIRWRIEGFDWTTLYLCGCKVGSMSYSYHAQRYSFEPWCQSRTNSIYLNARTYTEAVAEARQLVFNY